MFISLVQNQSVNVSLKNNDKGEKHCNFSLNTSMTAESDDTQVKYSSENVQLYCKKLSKLSGLDESREDGKWFEKELKLLRSLLLNNKELLNCNLRWSPAHPKSMHVRLSGKLLEKFYYLCGGKTLLTLKATFFHRRGGSHGYSRIIKLTTAGMGIFTTSNRPFWRTTNHSTISEDQNHGDSLDVEVEGCSSSSSETFCKDISAKLSDGLADVSNDSSKRLDSLSATVTIRLEVEDGYIYDEGKDVDDKMSICRNIFQNSIHSDVSIVAANRTIIPSHKCFLATHSSVLKAMLENNFQESKSNEIIMDDVSEEGVKALLEYIYTWEITEAVRSSKVAVELFQVAHKYDIKQLEEKLARMILQRGNKWFQVDATIDLFRFARKIEANSGDLKDKAVQALRTKREELMKSNGFKKLFTDDWETSMELCAMSLQSS